MLLQGVNYRLHPPVQRLPGPEQADSARASASGLFELEESKLCSDIVFLRSLPK
jgi:hypothetical protein